MSKIAIIGAGAWGTTLAILLSQGSHEISIWSYEKEVADTFQTTRENKKYLPGFPLNQKIHILNGLKESIAGSDFVIFAVPTQHLRNIIKEAAHFINKGMAIVSVSKGIEISTLKLPSQIIAEHIKNNIVVLSGPNLSKEIASGLPAATVAASKDVKLAKRVQNLFSSCKTFRVYTSPDPIGAEIGGALKNVIAIAAGALDGMELGDNAKSALIIRGIAEITKLGVKMGAKSETLSGLSSLGDLITTCQSGLSRNHTVGFRLAKGETLAGIEASLGQVAEGITTSKAVKALCGKYKVEMPICNEIYKVLFENKNVDTAVLDLMSRPLKPEI